MSAIDYIDQTNLLDYLTELYRYIKSKSESPSSGSTETPEYHLVIDGEIFDGDWNVVLDNTTGLYSVEKIL